MAKSIRNTTVSFGLVTVPVRVMAVSTSAKPDGMRLASPAGNPVKQTYVDDVTGEVVGPVAECVKGIFDDAGFHEVSADDLKLIDEAVEIDGIVIDGFVPVEEVPTERVRNVYYLAPGGTGGPATVQPLVALVHALSNTGKAGIGTLTLSKKQYPFVLREKNGGLILTTLAFAAEVAALAEAAFEGVEVPEQIIGFATTLVESQTVDVSTLDEYADERTARRTALIEDVVAGKAISIAAKPAEAAPVADLASLLAKSVEQSSKKATAKKKAA